ncbi:MAG: sugar ABC transporter substrate-binding protein [Nocardioidaceae bacterium]
MKTFKWAGALAATTLVLAACSGTGQDDEGAESAEQADLTVAVVAHGAPDDAFWTVVQNGAERAGEDLGVAIDYNTSDDVATQAGYVDSAVADEVDGIVVSLANPDGMRESVQAAVDAGIPVITINSGLDVYQEFGAITHVGQSETLAGQTAGEQFSELGATKILCVLHEAANIGLQERCQGASEGFDGEVEPLQVDGTQRSAVAESVGAALAADESVDGVLALNADVALGAVQAVEDSGREVQVGTFDLSSDLLAAVEDGSVEFAIDQQPYIQGYLGVQFIYLYTINGNEVGGGQPVNSGPAVITQENAAEVAEFAEQGTR